MIVRSDILKANSRLDWKLADLLARLGDVDPARIRLDPRPGWATDEECTESKDLFGCLCEMVDGTLVEKVMAWEESCLAAALARLIGDYLKEHPLGIVLGPDGPVRIEPRVIRMPDISFISWDRVPPELDSFPASPVMELIPDLAIEVISPSNRPGEMKIKLQEYFKRGVKLVWYLYHSQRKLRSFSSPKRGTDVRLDDYLDGRDVLPGFRIKLQDVYDQAFPKRPKKKRGN
jgi:Uma2 family endonuclease